MGNSPESVCGSSMLWHLVVTAKADSKLHANKQSLSKPTALNGLTALVSCPGQEASVHWSLVQYTKNSQVQFPVRAHMQVVASIPSQVEYERQLVAISLLHLCFSLSPSLFFSLYPTPLFPLSSLSKINKHILRWGLMKTLKRYSCLSLTPHPAHCNLMGVSEWFCQYF